MVTLADVWCVLTSITSLSSSTLATCSNSSSGGAHTHMHTYTVGETNLHRARAHATTRPCSYLRTVAGALYHVLELLVLPLQLHQLLAQRLELGLFLASGLARQHLVALSPPVFRGVRVALWRQAGGEERSGQDTGGSVLESPVLPLLTWRSSSDMVECGCSFW